MLMVFDPRKLGNVTFGMVWDAWFASLEQRATMMSFVPPSSTPKLFISYSHDSQEHQDRVRQLADRLRSEGIDAWIDQYSPAPSGGWPMWMQEKILNGDFVLLVCTETYLRRVEQREEPGKGRGVLWEAKLIYNLLYLEDADVQKFIPIVFAEGQPSWIPLPLRGSARYQVDTEEGFEDLYRHLTNQPHVNVPSLGRLRSLPAKEPASFPASLGATHAPKPTRLEQRSRQAVIKRVRNDWIEGVLDQSLYKVARIEFGLADKSDLLEQPLNAVVQVPDRDPRAVPPGTPISQVFDEQDGALLILGAPGTGKTTLLLELARDLLVRAESDESRPIPVVFNLSSWAVRRQPLSDWLVSELNERSDVPKKLAQQWVKSEQILPLLDGLDEVAAAHREGCVAAINNFRREHGLLQIAVCSRIADYKELGTTLRLRNAVEVQPLTRRHVEDYLERVGEPLQGLRAAVEDDPTVWELLETPLMLWVAMLAYREVPHVYGPGASLEQRRRQLFASFVEAMFRRKVGKKLFNSDRTTRWLSSLACTLTRNNQTIFYLESLDFHWLPTRAQQWLARVGLFVFSVLIFGLINGVCFGLVLGLIGGLIGELSFGVIYGLILGLIAGLIVGPIIGLLATVLQLQPVEKSKFRWADISSRRSKDALLFGLIGGLIFGLIGGLTNGLSGGLRSGLIGGLFAGLRMGLIGGLIAGLIRLFTSETTPETRVEVNEGTHRSIKMALVVGLIFGLIAGLMFGLSGGLIFGLSEEMSNQLSKDLGETLSEGMSNELVARLFGGLGCGVFLGVIAGMLGGGLFAMKHLVLRLFLWRSGSAPLRYVAFLAQVRELLFLQRVGGGYIFTHRLLQEHFVSLSQPKQDSEAPSARPKRKSS